MTVQAASGAGIEVNVARGTFARTRRIWWALAVLAALAVAAAVTAVIATHGSSSVKRAPLSGVSNTSIGTGQLPARIGSNPDTRAGHLAPPVTSEPNANSREGRLPVLTNPDIRAGHFATPSTEPNANSRGSRGAVSTQDEPNANSRESRGITSSRPEPNANIRESRGITSSQPEPNANAREGRLSPHA